MKKILLLVACLFCLSSVSMAEEAKKVKIDYNNLDYMQFYTKENKGKLIPSFEYISKLQYKQLSKEEKKKYKRAKSIEKWINYYSKNRIELENYFLKNYPNHLPLRISIIFQHMDNKNYQMALYHLEVIKNTPSFMRYMDKKIVDILHGYLLALNGDKKGINILRKYKNEAAITNFEKYFKNYSYGLDIIAINGILEQNIIEQKIKASGVFIKSPNFMEIMQECPYGDGDYWFDRHQTYQRKLKKCLYNYSGKNFVSCIEQLNKDQEILSQQQLNETNSKRNARALYAIEQTQRDIYNNQVDIYNKMK